MDIFYSGKVFLSRLGGKCAVGCEGRNGVSTRVEQVFSRTGQLSEVNLDPDTLAYMTSIVVNKLAYKPSQR